MSKNDMGQLENEISSKLGIRPGTIIRHILFSSMLKDSINSNDLVLDIGGFDGTIASMIEKTTKAKVIVLDIDRSGLKLAEQKKIQALNASATDIPLGDSTVMVVLSFDNIEHIKEDKKVFSEISRILKPNGILILTTTCDNFSLPFYSKKNIAKKWGHVRIGYKFSELRLYLDHVGINIVANGVYNTFLTRLVYVILFIVLRILFTDKYRNKIFIKILKFEKRWKFGAFEHWVIARRKL